MTALVKRTGQVTRIAATATKPNGSLQAGGYDPATNTLHLGSGGAGHPRGVAATGGDPSAPGVAGVTVFEHEDGRIYWANDSFSLPRQLTQAEAAAVQGGLEQAYPGCSVTQVVRIGDVPK